MKFVLALARRARCEKIKGNVMSCPESRIAALEAQLAQFMREMSHRLDDQKEDIGALADALNSHEKHPNAHAEVFAQNGLKVK